MDLSTKWRTSLKKSGEYAEYLKSKRHNAQLAQNLLMDDVYIVVTTCYGTNSLLLMKVDVAVSPLTVDKCAQIVESEMLIALNLLRDKRSDGPVKERKYHRVTDYFSFVGVETPRRRW